MANIKKVILKLGTQADDFLEWEHRDIFGEVCNHGFAISFANGYTADITDTGYGREDGLLETAVMYDGDIVYDTPITDDVIGWQDEEEAYETALAISKLPPR